jgi:uncharacterized membrane protein
MLQYLITQQYYFPLKIFAAIGCGLISGVFFAFSAFVMNALSRRPSAQGISAMQSINIAVVNPLFMTAFLGTGVACLILLVVAIGNWQQPDSVYLLTGSLLYLLGAVGVTIAFNVPLNDELATVQPNSSDAKNAWVKYLSSWTVWNHLRTLASLCAAVVLSISLGR